MFEKTVSSQTRVNLVKTSGGRGEKSRDTAPLIVQTYFAWRVSQLYIVYYICNAQSVKGGGGGGIFDINSRYSVSPSL